jgi:uncharacterized protein (TIGR02246 family)
MLCLGPTGPGEARQADGESAVRAHFDAFARAWVAGDARAVAAEFAEDADLLRPNQPPVVGRSAIEAFYAQMFAGPLKGVAKKTTVDRVRLVTPLVAVVDSSYTLDRDDPALHARGASLTVMEKREGRWLTVLSRSYRLPAREAR